MQEQCSRRICSPSAYPRPRVFHTSPLFHSVCQNVFCFFLFLKSHKLLSCRFPVVTVLFFLLVKTGKVPTLQNIRSRKKGRSSVWRGRKKSKKKGKGRTMKWERSLRYVLQSHPCSMYFFRWRWIIDLFRWKVTSISLLCFVGSNWLV